MGIRTGNTQNKTFDLEAFKAAVSEFLSLSDFSADGISPADVPALLEKYTVLPGFCDVHTHFREPGFSYKETIASGCAAAARGGVTTVCTMPNLSPVPDSPANLAPELDAIRRTATVTVLPYGALTVGERGEIPADLAGMAGDVVAFSDDGKGVQSREMMRALMTEVRRLGKVLAAHCEENSLLRGGYIHDGSYARAHGHAGICSESEWRPIARDLELAAETGCAYHVCHISTRESVALIRDAKRAGVDVTCETGPHYLTMDDGDLREDGRFKMNPPLRSPEDREALLEGLCDGTIDMIATDHAPHSAEEKSRGLRGSAFGVVGLETSFPVVYTRLVLPGVITLEKAVGLMAVAPRLRFGIPFDGSFTLWDTDASFTVDPAGFASMGRATPFEGWELRGVNRLTVAGGKIVYKNLYDRISEETKMAKRTDIKKILIIGSGPIVIGQAAEFDYAGTQACLALKEEGYEVVLCNSNPATIMTDTAIADKVYMEPLTLEYIAKILRYERPDAIVPGIGGQTGLNLAMQLEKKGILKECHTELLGTDSSSIERAEDRELFKEMCQSIGEPVIPSEITYDIEHAKEAARHIGYPVVLRPAFTLGGTGGGFAYSEEELVEIATNGFALSPVHQVLVEKSVRGYKEIEFEVMRDSSDHAITICGMENVDPVGVHTGDSIVVAPIMSLNDHDLKMLNDSAIKIIRELKIEGGCNVQFALNPTSSEYFLIEVNPRVSRSSALASKASGYPIARVTAKIAVGMALEEIPVAGGTAAIEPRLDYVVAKFPRFPFDKFSSASNQLGTQMKATGEVMGIGSTLEECMLKSVRSLEIGCCHFHLPKFDGFTTDELLRYVAEFRADGIFAVVELLRRGVSVAELHGITRITEMFLESFAKIVAMEKKVAAAPRDLAVLREAKTLGFSDPYIAKLWGVSELTVFALRRENGIRPVFRMVDTLHTGKYIAYLYSSYTGKNDSRLTDKKKIVVLGAGPIRIGQGVEFDYSTVHAVQTIGRAGYESIIINNNPETVSTDYTTADKLYFEPLTPEDVMNILDFEQPEGVVASLGGQTAINLADPLMERGVSIIGTDCAAIDRAENRDLFEKLLVELGIPQPEGQAVTKIEDGVAAAARIGYPVLVRPSFVLGGRAMQIVGNEEQLRHYLKTAVEIDEDKPVLVDKYIIGKEVEVDAICDGRDVFVPGIMELVERTGIHSGDSISVYPSFSISDKVKGTILQYAKKLGIGIGIVGLYNIQFIVDRSDKVYIIEVNPRSSRTVPFLSKATGYSLADIATEVILGKTLKEQGIFDIYPDEKKRFYVKVPVFSFNKIKGLDAYLSPEMKSTGEAIGYDDQLNRALYKALQASGMHLQNYGTVFCTIADEDKEEALPLIRRFYDLGFNIEATSGTARFLKEHGIRTHVLGKISEGSDEIPRAIRQGHIAYVINTSSIGSTGATRDGYEIRKLSTESNTTMFTSLDTVKVLLDVLDEITLRISTINA